MCVYSNVRTLAVVEYMHRGEKCRGREHGNTINQTVTNILLLITYRDNYDYCYEIMWGRTKTLQIIL